MVDRKKKSSITTPKNRNIYISKSNSIQRSYPITKKIILGVILVATLIVFTVSIFALFFDKKNLTEFLINKIAADYYENYYYPNFSSTKGFKQAKDLDSAMEKYRNYGFAPVTLRQLLLYDNRKNAKYADPLKKYCNENYTVVKFYIDPPYGKSNYHYDITYSCNY